MAQRLRDVPTENWAQTKPGWSTEGHSVAMAVQGGNTVRHEMKHSGSILADPTTVLSATGSHHSCEPQAGTPASPRKHLGEAPAELKAHRRTRG